MPKKNNKQHKTIFVFTCFFLGASSLGLSTALAGGDDFPIPEFSFIDETLEFGKTYKEDPFDYRPPPKFFKGLVLHADLSVAQSYNTNIRADKNNPDSDLVTTIEPSLKIQKDISKHSIYMEADAQIRRAFDNKDENTEDYKVQLAADFNAFRGFTIPFRVGVNSSHRPRNSIVLSADSKTKVPIETQMTYVKGGFVYDPQLLTVSANISHQQRRNTNNTIRSTNQPEILEDRDIDVTSYNLMLAYTVLPNLEPFLKFQYEDIQYLRPAFQNGSFSGIKRDNQYSQYLIGTLFNYKGLIYGDAAIGFDNREYDNASVSNTNNLSYEANIFWEPTRKSKFNLVFNQGSFEDNEIVSGYDRTSVDLTYDYEFQRDMYLRALASYRLRDFSSINRTDTDYIGGLELKYFISSRFQIGAEYLYTNRQSTEEDTGFDQNQVTLRLTGAL